MTARRYKLGLCIARLYLDFLELRNYKPLLRSGFHTVQLGDAQFPSFCLSTWSNYCTYNTLSRLSENARKKWFLTIYMGSLVPALLSYLQPLANTWKNVNRRTFRPMVFVKDKSYWPSLSVIQMYLKHVI